MEKRQGNYVETKNVYGEIERTELMYCEGCDREISRGFGPERNLCGDCCKSQRAIDEYRDP